uniref:Granulocyte-macrophage colony-stimulating factor receptor subunit alpha-like n=1 Tax=Castor canadensis TaxID=51338 RepID=A0A8B7UUE0_CASCN|nr:granulocyte-macrophage colony-stimulating factor receptor subunit alpha-like [Castor canadensis]
MFLVDPVVGAIWDPDPLPADRQKTIPGLPTRRSPQTDRRTDGARAVRTAGLIRAFVGNSLTGTLGTLSGAQLTVRGQVHGGDKFENTLIFNNSGMPGSGAVNFSCLIYRITFMNCTWVPGPAAPADVIYHLYSWFNRDDDEVECPQYLLDLRGTRVGCHFDQLGEPNRWDNYFFFINGTSQESLIPFVDFVPFVAVQNEKYNAPANVTVHNRGPETVIAWDNPHRRFDLAPATFCYELDLQRKIFQRGQDRNEYRVPRSQGDTESTVRIRVRHLRGHLWSDWSQTLSFGVPKDSHGHLAVTLGLVVGTVAMCTGVLLLLCKRCALRRKLFPNIPQVKGDFSTIFISNQEVTWAHTCPPAEPREAEDILTVQDTS